MAVYLRAVLSKGSNRTARLLAACGVLAAFCLLPAPPALAWDAPEELYEWHEGPVRYLMSRKEVRLFRRLDTDAERTAFIQRFWDRRDPDPRTPENELRAIFWARVAEANRRFSDSAYPGWKCDRGKIFIILGPPDDEERDLYYDTGLGDVGNRGLLRWHYEHRRRNVPNPLTVVAFVREIGGDWRLTDDPELNSIFFDMNMPKDELTAGISGQMERLMNGVPWLNSTIDVAMDLGRLQEVPTEYELLQTIVEAEDFVGTLRGELLFHLLTGRSGQALTSLTIAIPRNELTPAWDGSAASLGTRFTVTAQLTPLGEPRDRQALEIPDDAFRAEPAPLEDDPWLRFQAVWPVPAGSWNASVVLLDRAGGGSAVVRRPLDVPETGAGPGLSGPILAREILEAQGPATDPDTMPFRLWDQIVIPRMQRAVGADEPFALYVEAHSPADRPGTPVNLSWEIERAEAGGEIFEPFGPGGSAEDARGPRAWRYPAGRLPAGRYRITFTAVDEVGRTATRSAAFVVERFEDEPDAPR